MLLAGCSATSKVVDWSEGGQARLIRSSHSSVEDLEELHKNYTLGTVINLCGYDILEARRAGRDVTGWQAEKNFCEAHEITYRFMFSDGNRPPIEADISLFLRIANSEVFWPVLICSEDALQISFYVALYRIQFNGWTANRAINETGEYLSGPPPESIKNFLTEYKVRKLD